MSNLVSIVTSFVVGFTILIYFKSSVVNCSKIKKKPSERFHFAIVMRRDLGMDEGKMGKMSAHAAVSCYFQALHKNRDLAEEWQGAYQSTNIYKQNGTGEEELEDLVRKADAKNLLTCVVKGTHQMEWEGEPITAIGIGPGNTEAVKNITEHLKLL